MWNRLHNPISNSPHNWLHLPARPHFLPSLAAMGSPGRRGPMMGREPSPSSHTGVVTRGSCLPATSWVKVMHTCWLHSGWKTNLLLLISKITIFVFRYEAGLLLLICKITLNGPSPCLPSPSQAYGGYPIFLDTASSGPHYKSPPSLYPITVIHIGGTDST